MKPLPSFEASRVPPPTETKWALRQKTSLALAALMALSPALDTNAASKTVNPASKLEMKGNKVETFKNVTVEAIGPSHIEGQKRYQEISIINGGTEMGIKTGTILVRVLGELWTDRELIWNITKAADGEFWFELKKAWNPIYQDFTAE